MVWTGFPFIAVSVLAGLRTIPVELFESARVDGAGRWQIFWQVTYPLLRPIFQLLFLLSVIWDFGVFTQVYIIIGELGQRDEYNLGIYEYATAFQLPPAYGLASAAGLHPHDHPAHHHGRLRAGHRSRRGRWHDDPGRTRRAAFGPSARSRRRFWTRRARRAGLNLLGLLVALITLFPIFWMVSTAFKPATEWYSLTPHPFPAHPTLSNFRAVIDGSVIGLPYWNFLKNSLFVTVVVGGRVLA